ncbi:MAG: terminase small subunit [Desulfuromonadales bacterium]|nr:terminase small subunit [Desulfuromonadales bacterium]
MTYVPGQATLPALVEDLGYESITHLKPKQERFCWEYVLRNGNASASYLEAFTGSKPVSAKAHAWRLLKDERVQQRIEEIKAELQRRYAVNAGSLILYLSQVLNLDRRAFLDEKGDPKAANLLDTEAANILDLDFAVDRFGKQRAVYRIPTRMQASIELARMMGLHKDKVELFGDGSNPENTLATLIRSFSEPIYSTPFSDLIDEQLEEKSIALSMEALVGAGYTVTIGEQLP